MQIKFFNALFVGIVFISFLTISSNLAFGQCGIPGTPPCKTTPKRKLQPKRDSIVTKPRISKNNTAVKSKSKIQDVFEQNPIEAEKYIKYAQDNCAEVDFDCKILNSTKAIKLNSINKDFYLYRADSYTKSGNYDKSIDDYSKAIELNGKDAIAYNNRGWNYYLKGDYDRAISDANKSIDLDPKNAETFDTRANAYFKKGLYQLAIEDFNKSIELQPYTFVYYENRAQVFRKKGEIHLADADERKAKEVKINSEETEKYFNYAQNNCEKTDYECQIKNYTKAIELSPKLSNQYFYRANSYYLKGDYDESIKDNNKGIELNPTSAIAYYNRGAAYSRKGFNSLALKDFDKSIQLNPKFANAYQFRAYTYEQLGLQNLAELDKTMASSLLSKTPGDKADDKLNQVSQNNKQSLVQSQEETKCAAPIYLPSNEDYGYDIVRLTPKRDPKDGLIRQAMIPLGTNGASIIAYDKQKDLLLLSRATIDFTFNNKVVKGFKVLDIENNVIGYVFCNGQTYYTQKQKRDTESPFVREKSGNSYAAPVITIQNDADKDMTLFIDEVKYSIPSKSTKTISLSAGGHSYIATAPGVISLTGSAVWEQGSTYTWTFYIETKNR